MSSEVDPEVKCLQDEEVEVLESIYEGDEAFKAIEVGHYQYKLGQDGTTKSFILDITWGHGETFHISSIKQVQPVTFELGAFSNLRRLSQQSRQSFTGHFLQSSSD